MSVAKSAALGFLTWCALGMTAQAGPVSWTSTSNWQSWVAVPGGDAITNLGNLGTSLSANSFSPSVDANVPQANAQLVSNPPVAATPAPAAPAAAPSATTGFSGTYDAYINVGNGPYPEAGTLTTGGAQPWYDSPGVQQLFGGVPTTQQQADFANTVLQRVEQTFQLSGVPVTLTTDPNASAVHTLSVVSQTAGAAFGGTVIGLTDVGGNGFSFIDQIAKSVQTVDQLEWIVAHNVSHELMLAFGVGENYDKSGNYIDAPNATWAMMTSPSATFSQSASQALRSTNFLNNVDATSNPGAQLISEPQFIPEPSTVLLWAAGVSAAAFLRVRRTNAKRRASDV